MLQQKGAEEEGEEQQEWEKRATRKPNISKAVPG